MNSDVPGRVPGIADSVADLVGNTPLVRLNRTTQGLGAQVAAKCEFLNPGGSVKDRIGLAMIDDAEREGRIAPDRTVIVEPTSGNTGIALAMVGAARGYRVIITLPGDDDHRATQSTVRLRRRGGPHAGGARDGSAPLTGRSRSSTAPRTRGCRSSSATPAIPRRTREPRPRRFGAIPTATSTSLSPPVGTGGTITGTARALKQRKPSLQFVGAEPVGNPVITSGRAGPHRIEGIGANFVPEVFERDLVDEILLVDDAIAEETARQLAAAEGLLVGASAGANVWVALQVAAAARK